MAKRELSSTIRNLKFMQRASQKEEKPKEEEEIPTPYESFCTPVTLTKKCIVIMEGNPHPGSIKGRMSFQSFNPSIDKLNEGTGNTGQMQACVDNQNGRIGSERVAGTSGVGTPDLSSDSPENCSPDLKRKQQPDDEKIETPPQKTTKQLDEPSSHNNNRRQGSSKQPKRETTDWNILRPPKPPKKS